LFDATEAAQMEEQMIMSIVRNAAPYFVRAFPPLLEWLYLIRCFFSATFEPAFQRPLPNKTAFFGRSM
jgi:hypothetical protein